MVTRAEAVVDAGNRIIAMDVVANSPPHGNRPGNGTPNLRAAAYIASGDFPHLQKDESAEG